MKKQIIGGLAALFLVICHAGAQPVSKTDAVALLDELAPPPSSVGEAFERSYPGGAERADIKVYYSPWIAKLERAGDELQSASKDYYMKNPMGAQQPARPASKASPEQHSAMEAATAELMQKMTSDPAFAKKFASMSEAEQQTYITRLLAEKGLKPASGTPNEPETLPEGSDVDWFGLSNELTQKTMEQAQWEPYMQLQQKYADEHLAIDAWTETEIKKLPMYSYGEYGHDHDPEQVKTVRKQGLSKHRDAAERMLKESVVLFEQRRKMIRERITPLNDALKKVSYGAHYSFGIHYQLVLGAQMTAFGELNNLQQNAADITNEAAKWEYEWRNLR